MLMGPNRGYMERRTYNPGMNVNVSRVEATTVRSTLCAHAAQNA